MTSGSCYFCDIFYINSLNLSTNLNCSLKLHNGSCRFVKKNKSNFFMSTIDKDYMYIPCLNPGLTKERGLTLFEIHQGLLRTVKKDLEDPLLFERSHLSIFKNISNCPIFSSTQMIFFFHPKYLLLLEPT